MPQVPTAFTVRKKSYPFAGPGVFRHNEGRQPVKFLCDRCKTRYSIGDDRVRGKILKIRCKNCANVITVY